MPSPVHVLRMGMQVPMIASALQRAASEADARERMGNFGHDLPPTPPFQQLPLNT